MRQEIGCIDVNVPPDIDMSKTSSDNAVQVKKPTYEGFPNIIQKNMK